MPKRSDLQKILIIGSGPIVIGQGCEFDYSGVQACKALKEEGYTVILVNSNPATIMTDPDLAEHTYIEPITWQTVARIIEIERPDAILSTMGGQTALNCALELDDQGILAKYNVELIGANREAIRKAEDREQFRQAMLKIGLDMPNSKVATNMQEAWQIQTEIGFPTIIRPSFTLGGTGGGIAYNATEFASICERGFALSMNHQLLIEESMLGWKEFELEVVRDINDSCIIVCTIENLDPMGVHTGDSITVAPAQTLTDVEYQIMRDAAIAVLREIGVQTGGSNVQFAVHPQTGRMVVIEMNPRVSRSSALASKATGFPIAKIAAKLAVGFTLDELSNDITGGMIPASFEPSIDYVVVKIPRFNFDKFPVADPRLTTQMQSVGEVMAIDATFPAALQKALCSLEADLDGFNPQTTDQATIIKEISRPSAYRLLFVADAFRIGMQLEEIYNCTSIDPWFLDQIRNIITIEQQISAQNKGNISYDQLLAWKQTGFSDRRIAQLLQTQEQQIRIMRQQLGIQLKFKRIDSCAAEFPANTAYLYSTFDGECEAQPSQRAKVIVLGSGPNRIGQGIEFDYCCVQAVQALQENNIEAIMINCNPETVSTDYDISDRLYFEPLRLENILAIIDIEQPQGVILQFGGQTPLKLAAELHDNGVKILGTDPATIDLAEDRAQFAKIISKLGLKQPEHIAVTELAAGLSDAEQLGYPLIVRPSYVLGGRAMEIVHNNVELAMYLQTAFSVSHNTVLIDRFLSSAIEVDVDVIADGKGGVFVAGIMEHVEAAGVHSGDSASCIPPHSLAIEAQAKIKIQARILALELGVIGLMNVQFALQNNDLYVLEVNPRASRTVPFVSKSIGMSIAKLAVSCMLGKELTQIQDAQLKSNNYAVKQSVFVFNKFPGVDPYLGPEMRSTGEVMSFGLSFAEAYRKTLQAINGHALPRLQKVFINIDENDVQNITELGMQLESSSISILCDQFSGEILSGAGIACKILVDEDIISLIASAEVDFIVSTACGRRNASQAHKVRQAALRYGIYYTTTIAAAKAVLLALQFADDKAVYKLQTMHKEKVLEYEY